VKIQKKGVGGMNKKGFSEIPASSDWGRYAAVYNRTMTYAPYTVPMDMRFVEQYLIPFMDENDTYAVIVSDGSGREGIAHISKCPDGQREEGFIAMLHLLLADTNDIAEFLLSRTEDWAKSKGLPRSESYSYKLNPYRYAMFGSEAYCWGGLYPTRNAFRRRGWDLEFDQINMILNMIEEPSVFDPKIPEAELLEFEEDENDLRKNGRFEARLGGKTVATCGYHYLKAISSHLGRPIGQIWIMSDPEVHGTGLGRQAITASHNRLYGLGARKVILVTNNNFFRAVKFYQSLGYEHELFHAFSYCKDF
jgi:GNAT superfamily N-acetyltransferase